MMIVVTTVASRHGYNNIVTTVIATVVTIVVMTVATRHGYNNVVTTVITENRMPTHTIFFLMSDARCRVHPHYAAQQHSAANADQHRQQECSACIRVHTTSDFFRYFFSVYKKSVTKGMYLQCVLQLSLYVVQF